MNRSGKEQQMATNGKTGTRMKAFGTSSRIGHDSSDFYSRSLYAENGPEEVKDSVENPVPEVALDKVLCKSSEDMGELPDNCIHLMMTSPPYNVGKEYDQNLSLNEYRQLLSSVLKEVYRVLVVGGRASVNVANLGRKPYIPLHLFVVEEMLSIGFFMRGEIIWDKSSSSGTSMAWGSWQSASNPTLRDTHEYILVFSKGSAGRHKSPDKPDSITRDEFMEFTKSIWSFPAQRASAVNHPAPFPVELPSRLVKLYTFVGDTVLDPFIGSGTTAVAALRNGRHYVGYDNSDEYCNVARKRISDELREMKREREQTKIIPPDP